MMLTQPGACPTCGGSRTVWIFWDYSMLTENQSQALADGRAVLGLNRRYFGTESVPKGMAQENAEVSIHRFERSFLPTSACLDCEPGWADLHQLARQELDLEAAKATACDQQQFEKAAAIFKSQEKLELAHASEVWRLLRNLASDALLD